jgi:hypothetical protein
VSSDADDGVAVELEQRDAPVVVAARAERREVARCRVVGGQVRERVPAGLRESDRVLDGSEERERGGRRDDREGDLESAARSRGDPPRHDHPPDEQRIGASWNLDEAITRFGVQQVIITFSTAPDDVLLRLVRRCEELGIGVSVVPRLFERMPERYSIDHVGGIALVSPRRADPRTLEFPSSTPSTGSWRPPHSSSSRRSWP